LCHSFITIHQPTPHQSINQSITVRLPIMHLVAKETLASTVFQSLWLANGRTIMCAAINDNASGSLLLVDLAQPQHHNTLSSSTVDVQHVSASTDNKTNKKSTTTTTNNKKKKSSTAPNTPLAGLHVIDEVERPSAFRSISLTSNAYQIAAAQLNGLLSIWDVEHLDVPVVTCKSRSTSTPAINHVHANDGGVCLPPSARRRIAPEIATACADGIDGFTDRIASHCWCALNNQMSCGMCHRYCSGLGFTTAVRASDYNRC
jgi:hypothetical protein